MRKLHVSIAAATLLGLSATPAMAGWKVVPHGMATAVAKSTLRVTPGEDWNQSSVRPVKQSEVWTLDGDSLNQLYFVSGLAAGGTLLRDSNKKSRPLPKMNGAMQLADIPEFFESSWRLGLNTSLFEMGAIEPTKLDGHDAVRFAYQYTVQGEMLTRKGIAVGTVVKGQLYLINFVAPSTYYFDRDRSKAQAIFDSARL